MAKPPAEVTQKADEALQGDLTTYMARIRAALPTGKNLVETTNRKLLMSSAELLKAMDRYKDPKMSAKTVLRKVNEVLAKVEGTHPYEAALIIDTKANAFAVVLINRINT